MPPPPPPSKSYLLQLDTDTEEENEEEISLAPSLTPTLYSLESSVHSLRQDALSLRSPSDLIPDDDYVDTEDDVDRLNELDTSPAKAKRRQRRKRDRKNKSKGTVPIKELRTSDHHVSFGTVSLRLVERTVGGDGVPVDGGWPLTLSETVLEEVEAIPIDEFESERLRLLQERWKSKVKSEEEDDSPTTLVLETRQWDYKKPRDNYGNSIRNPLFGPLTEEERHELIIHKTLHTTASKGSSPTKRRTQSMSTDLASGPYDPVLIRHIRNELEDLRVSRSSEGNAGCTCRKLHVHFPPKKGGGGKKSQHKRMNSNKVKEELRKRHLLPEKTVTREELEQILYDAVQKEPCCGPDCSCVRNGLSCQADACSCWYHSHNAGNEAASSIENIKTLCGNINGMYVVDFRAISSFRKDMICQVIQPAVVVEAE